MADTDKDFTDLDGFFDAARRDMTGLPDGLADRILADAQRVQNDRLPPRRRAAPGVLRQFLDMLGGWPAMGGLATACAAGIWLGFAPPAALPDPVQLVQSEPALFDDDDLFTAMSEEG